MLPETPLLTTDCVVFNDDGDVLLIKRRNPPFQNSYALPGGFVDVGETVEAACRRELKEETGLEARELELVGVYSDPDRDPRGHTASVVFLATVNSPNAVAGTDAMTVEWVESWTRVDLAFDHAKILKDAENLWVIKMAD